MGTSIDRVKVTSIIKLGTQQHIKHDFQVICDEFKIFILGEWGEGVDTYMKC